MRRVSTRLFALAGVAAFVAAPTSRAGAQVSPSSSNSASAKLVAYGTDCSSGASTEAYNNNVSQGCLATDVSVTPTGMYTAAAQADVVAGASVHAMTHFNGAPGDVDDNLESASGIYYRYISFGPGVAQLVFSSNVTTAIKSIISDVPGEDPHGSVSYFAHIDIGLLTADNEFNTPPEDTFSYGGGSSFGGTVDVDGTLGGAHSFYYALAAGSQITISKSDPIADAEIFVLNPDITCFDDAGARIDCHLSFDPPAVTGTPEPASLALMGTGLVGVAGFARRKRRATTAA